MYIVILFTLLLFQDPPSGGIRNPNIPRTDQPPGNGNQNPSGMNVMVDGMYTILAYEKFGQTLPGMVNNKVVIRNNIMTFPGDTKIPGKMLQLSFGPNNTITITPLDGRNPSQPPINQAGANTNNGQTVDNKQTTQTGANNQNGNSGGQTPVIPPINQAGNNTGQNKIMAPPSERGVYVLSTEFFCIIVMNQIPTQTTGGPIYNNNQNPGNGSQNPTANNNGQNAPAKDANNNGGQVLPWRNHNPPGPQPGGGTTGSSQAVLVLKRIAN